MREDKAEIENSGLYQSTSLLLIIICWGSLLRLAQYLFNRSLWLDESMLALNIVNREFSQLLSPLDYDQGAPLGFLMLERLAVQVFGTSEYALRLFPLISGIISLFLFYHMAKRTVTSKAVPIALGLFAISGPLIYYSSEVKQYSSDVAIAISLYSAAIYYESCKLTPWRVAVFGFLGAVPIWFSHSSVFILAGIGVTLTSLCLTGRRWARIGIFSIVYSLWALSFAACYLISLRHLANNNSVVNYWTFAFVPSPFVSVAAMGWFVYTFFEIFKIPAGLELKGLAALTFFFGCISMISNKREKFFILMSPVLLTLIAAGFHMYPFNGRMILFIVPVLLLFIAEGTELIRSKIKGEASLIVVCLIGFLFFHPSLYSTYHLLKPTVKEEIKPVMNHIMEHQHEEDVLYVYNSTIPAFRYYATRFGLDKMDLVMGMDPKDNWENYEKDIEQLRGYRRVWLLFSHSRTRTRNDEEKVFLYLLDKRGAKLDYFKSAGAAVYLYDFDKPGSLNGGAAP